MYDKKKNCLICIYFILCIIRDTKMTKYFELTRMLFILFLRHYYYYKLCTYVFNVLTISDYKCVLIFIKEKRHKL